MSTMHADQVRAGDVVEYNGERHHITSVQQDDGWAWPIACGEAGWAIAIGHDLTVVSHELATGLLVSDAGDGPAQAAATSSAER